MSIVRQTAFATALALSISACASLRAPASDSLIGEWTVVSIDATTPANPLTVNFDETSRISGSAGCNRFTGAYSYDQTAGTVRVTPLGVTRMYCSTAGVMEQERRFITALQAATAVETTFDGSTSLKSPTGEVLLRRRSGPPATTAATKTKPPENTTTVLTTTPAYTPPTYTTPATPPTYSTPTTPAYTPPYASAPPPLTTPEVPGQVTASGELFFLERIALPPGAQVRIQLRDTARVGAPALVLAQQEFAAGSGGPYPFSISAPTNVVPANARLTLFAQILSGGRLLFITDTSNPVSATGPNAPMSIRMVSATASGVSRPPITTMPVTPAPVTTLPTAPAPTTYPVYPGYGTTPAAPSSPTSSTPTLAGGPGTPTPTSYRCGSETLQVAFDGAMAWLTTPDGVLAVPRVNPSDDPFAQRMYSNSRLTFIQDQDSANGGRVQFARGRMALQTCAKVG
ncbi:MAG: META domain-containing protein [Alphaproteobacteria bacterium]|nr:META domain-containing protein [Alphaproteobacteria bacterium]